MRSSVLQNLFRTRAPMITRRALATVSAGPHALTIQGSHIRTPFPYRWLRDSCLCPNCILRSTGQKLHRTSDIPEHIRPSSTTLDGANAILKVEWMDGHQSVYPMEFLERFSSKRAIEEFRNDVGLVGWNKNRIESSENLFTPYEDLDSPKGLLGAITQLSRYGLAFIKGVPNEEVDHEKSEVRKLAGYFGEMRTTFYGEQWDVRNRGRSSNIAYTDLHLGLHCDLVYFEHPPRFQVLHCIRNRVHGGTSVFTDALQAAHTLRETHPADFEILATMPVPYHYMNDRHHLHKSVPIIEVKDGEVQFINYAPPFQAPLPVDTPAEFYSALRTFTELLEDPANRYEYLLKEQDAVMFDNRRVLHARRAFREMEGYEEGETNRLLHGAYFESDTLLDRGRVLRSLK